jgi:hypothetical protein
MIFSFSFLLLHLVKKNFSSAKNLPYHWYVVLDGITLAYGYTENGLIDFSWQPVDDR